MPKLPIDLSLDRRQLFLTVAALGFAQRASGASPLRRVAFMSGAPDDSAGRSFVACFVKELQSRGWTEGENIDLAIRFAGDAQPAFEQLLAELKVQKPEVLVVSSTFAAQIAHRLITDFPVVFLAVSDPIKSGIADSLPRPGGNMTGVSNFLSETTGKLLEIMTSAIGVVRKCAVIYNPENIGKHYELEQLRKVASQFSISLEPIEMRKRADASAAFRTILLQKCDALVVLQDGATIDAREPIVDFARSNAIPAIYQISEFVEAGGLMSFGLNYCDHFARGAVYVDKILRGGRPNDLPVEQPTMFEMVINLRTANAMRLNLPATLLALADRVIE